MRRGVIVVISLALCFLASLFPASAQIPAGEDGAAAAAGDPGRARLLGNRAIFV